MKRLRLAAAVCALTALIAVPVAYAAGLFNGFPVGNGASYCSGYSGYPTTPTTPGTLPSGVVCNSTVPAGPPLTGNEYYPADTAVPGSLTQTAPSTILVPGTAIAGSTWMNGRNLLGNGALNGTQVNGTATVTGATTSAPTSAALIADRWVLDTNVGSGAGRSAIVTSSPSPPAGFTQVATVYRTSGILTQPICSWQAVPTPDSIAVAGQTVTFSAYVAALAVLASDNGSVANLVVITGTGTDQGFNGSWTATPAITPAWTGIATAINTPISLTTSFARYSTTVAIPATATEIGVGICFTPTAAAVAAATDGIAFVGAQLERGNSPSLYEFKTRAKELQENLAFVWSIHEGATLFPRTICHATTAGAGNGAGVLACPFVFPTQMYKAPTMVYATGFAGFTTTAETTATVCSALAANASIVFVPSTQMAMATCALTSSTIAVGLSMTLADDNGTGVVTAWTGL